MYYYKRNRFVQVQVAYSLILVFQTYCSRNSVDGDGLKFPFPDMCRYKGWESVYSVYPEPFRSENGKDSRPILRQVIGECKWGARGPLIVSGTSSIPLSFVHDPDSFSISKQITPWVFFFL